MTPTLLFTIIILLLIIEFSIDKIIDHLNARHFDDEIPGELTDVYQEEEYKKSQAYQWENYRFSLITSSFQLILTLAFFFFEGFAWVDQLARSLTSNEVLVALCFFGIILLGSDLLQTPFSYYKNFVIEEKYGFNRSSKELFFTDKMKGWLISIIIGGGLLSIVLTIYSKTGPHFWIYAWLVISIFTLFMTLFYSTLIVPLFNRQEPLEDGNLKRAIKNLSQRVNFKAGRIFVIDGSKRSSKANAYFSGFGSQKRIVLYDTLISDLEQEEIVAVLAHEVGHYKKKHVVINVVLSILITGFSLFIFSLLIENRLLSEALSVATPSFHIGLITFGIIYSPISEITGIIMNYVSRKFEYQADDFAKTHASADALISSLKKLSKNSLSNLTPHKATVFVHYSHPTLYQRILHLKRDQPAG